MPQDLAVFLGLWPECSVQRSFGLAWGLMAGLRGLPVMGTVFGLGAAWLPGTHPPFSDTVVNW